MAYTGRLHPKEVPFSQVYEKLEVSPLEAQKGREISHFGLQKGSKGLTDHRCIFLAAEEWRKHFNFVIYSYLKDSPFITFGRDARF